MNEEKQFLLSELPLDTLVFPDGGYVRSVSLSGFGQNDVKETVKEKSKMSLPKYRIQINGKYLKGYDDSVSMGKSGHMGWQPKAVDMPTIVLTDCPNESLVVEGNIGLKSQFERIYDRMRFGGLTVERLEIIRKQE